MLRKIFSVKDDGIYSIITIFGIKITFKPNRLKAIELQRQFDNYFNEIRSIKTTMLKGAYCNFEYKKGLTDYSIISNNIYVSVVIYVYNSGRENLTRCLDSIINQTLKNIEIFIINDASNIEEDDIICLEYKNKDNRITYIKNKEHKGINKSRLSIIDDIKGYTISFINSFDYLHLETYEYSIFSLLENNVDIVIFGTVRIKNKELKELDILDSLIYDDEILKSYIKYHPYILDTLSNKIYKIDSFDFNVLYDSANDNVINFRIFDKVKSVISIPFYCYYYNFDSYKNYLFNKEYIKSCLETCVYLSNYYDYNYINFNYLYAYIFNNLYYEIYDNLKFTNRSLFEELENYLKELLLSHLTLTSKLNYLYVYYLLNELSSISYNSLAWYRKEIHMSFYSILLKEFENDKIDNNSVLIVELNNCHGEVIPGIVKYFLDLNYNVDVLMNYEIYLDKVLSRFSNIRSYIFSKEDLPSVMRSKKISKYKYVFFTSFYLYYTSNNWPSLYNIIGNLRKINKNVFVMEHHLDLANKNLLSKKRLIAMHNLQPSNFPIYINPHYFGDVKITSKNKNITKFIIIGALDPYRRNSSLLFDSLNKLLDSGYNNFKLIVIGRSKISNDLSKLKDYIELKGRVDFPTLYNCMEESDFFLPMLDPDNETHNRYLKYGVSGSFQLIYGFRKPCILNSKFASVYGIDNNNSILYYDNNSFIEAMKTAIDMTYDEYSKKQSNLDKYVNNLYKSSLNNMKSILK